MLSPASTKRGQRKRLEKDVKEDQEEQNEDEKDQESIHPEGDEVEDEEKGNQKEMHQGYHNLTFSFATYLILHFSTKSNNPLKQPHHGDGIGDCQPRQTTA